MGLIQSHSATVAGEGSLQRKAFSAHASSVTAESKRAYEWEKRKKEKKNQRKTTEGGCFSHQNCEGCVTRSPPESSSLEKATRPEVADCDYHDLYDNCVRDVTKNKIKSPDNHTDNPKTTQNRFQRNMTDIINRFWENQNYYILAYLSHFYISI